jgi:hypothetical protein
MSEPLPIVEHDTEPRTGPAARLGRGLVRVAVFLFVVWQLAFLLFRNTVDSWRSRLEEALGPKDRWGEFGERVADYDRITTRYAALCGIEQGWPMFSGPLARSAPFPAVHIVFADGSQELVVSDNEPADPNFYFRFGGERHRKLEDYLASPLRGAVSGVERPLWEAYARDAVRRFRAAHPDDRRAPVKALVIARRLYYTRPDQSAGDRDPMVSTLLTEFDLPAGL